MLEALKILKNWFTNGTTREQNWDEIANNILAYSVRTNNNLKQIGLDIVGASYDFNNVGKSTQSTPIASRITTLESLVSGGSSAGNLAIDLTDTSKIVLCAADGSALSTTNFGQITLNSTTTAGEVVTRNITSNLEVTLTGAHWGFDTYGDLTDYPLWIMLIDTGSAVVLGVAAQAGRTSITTSDDETSVGNVSTFSKVLVSTALTGECNVAYLGWVKANFDDTGNGGGENFWTVQTGAGDVNIGSVQTLHFGEVRA